MSTLGGQGGEAGRLIILPRIRDPRFITVRRGGSLRDDDHHLLAMWAADCAEHVLHHFEQARPEGKVARIAIPGTWDPRVDRLTGATWSQPRGSGPQFGVPIDVFTSS